MYGIGTVARLAQVSVRTLRYYDELGLLRPRWTDPGTGHRWYAPDQLPRLHRILALRDLGVGLADIGRLPAYSDRAVEAGKSYRYQVTALDRAGNESPRSDAAAASL